MVAVAVLYIGAASPARAIDAPEGLNVTDAEGQPVPDIRVENAAPGDSVERTWFITLEDGAPPTDVTYLFTGFEDIEVGCNAPEAELDETCESSGEPGEGTDEFAAAALGDLPGELDQNLVMRLAAGSVGQTATTCSGPGVQVVSNRAPSSFMNNPQSLGSGTLLAGQRLCVAVALNLPATATNIVQSDYLAFNFALNAVPAALPPDDEDPPREPEEPTVNPPDGEDPETPPRPEPPPGRSSPPRPPLAATGLGLATLLTIGAAMLSTGTLLVSRARRRRSTAR